MAEVDALVAGIRNVQKVFALMADPKALYQEVILDHNRSRATTARWRDASHQAEGLNPLCGDHLSVTLKLEGETHRRASRFRASRARSARRRRR